MIPHVENSNKIDDEELIYYDNEKKNMITWKEHLLLNRPLKVIVILLFTSTLSPLLIYYYIFFNNSELPPSDGFSFGSCLVPRESRIPCGVGLTNENDCHSQCCFDLDNNFCFHRFPSRFTYITPTNQDWNESVLLTPRIDTVPYKSQLSLPQISLHIDEVSSTHLTLSFNSQQSPKEGKKLVDKQYIYEISSPELNIFVNRTQTDNNVIFNTNGGVMIASDNIWEISFLLTKETMYGFGKIPLKATDKIIYNYAGSNSIPIIFAKYGNEYHGLLFDVSEPTELKILEDNQIIVRSLTNSGLKFHLFVGPEPKDIMKDVTEFIGFNGRLEYWMLGAHICSELLETSNNFEEFLVKYSEESIPFDSHCGTQPIVFENEPVNLERLKNDGELLKKHQKRIVPHVSPYIRYNNESEIEVQNNDTNSISKVTKNLISEVFKEFILRNPDDGDIYVGEIKNQTFVYPDYENASVDFMKQLWQSEIELDGVVLENSWPTDDSIKNFDEMYEAIPYFSQNFEAALEVTPKWNIERSNGEKYFYAHNLHGNHFADAFSKMFTKDPPIWISSQWRNRKVSVNQQNVETSWASLQAVLISAALGGISGQRLWSSPICGDTENFDPTSQTNLCTKWYMAATYLPVIKIHSKEVARHPLAFSGTNMKYITTALKHRMRLLPYFNTVLQNGPLLRPMFYQFPSYGSLADLTSQFSVGDDLLIVPNLLPSQSQVRVWLPPGTWYELWSGYQIKASNEGEPVTMTTTEADLLTLIRGGSIVTLQKDVKSTADITRLQSDVSLIIALECNPSCNATGNLYIDTVMSILFTAETEELTIESIGTNFEHLCTDKAISSRLIKDIQIYGLAEEFNNYDYHRTIAVDTDLCVLEAQDSIRIPFM